MKICESCGNEIVGFDTDGYCENCLCLKCGTQLETENERAMCMCDECEEKERHDEDM